MTRAQLQTLIIWSLGAVTLLVVGVCLEPALPFVGSYFTEAIVFGLLTAFAIALGLYLDRADISFAHAIGLIAFLSLGASAYPVMTLALFVGALVGSWGHQLIIRRDEHRRAPQADLRYIIYSTAQITLSFYASARVYIDIAQGDLPLDIRGDFSWQAKGVPLAAYLLCYVALYFAIFVLHIYSEQANWRTITTQNRLPVILLLLLPIPFALVAADVTRIKVSFIYFTIVGAGITLTIFGMYMLTRAEQRQRRQFQELQSLSQATSMIRGSLNLETLISMLYTQVHDLLKIDSMTLALRSDIGSIDYRLVMRRELSVLVPQMVPDDDLLVRYVLNTASPLRLTKFQDTLSPVLPLPYQAHAWMGVPLLLGQQTIGVMSVLTYEPERMFTNSELRLLTIVASSASIAVENARLYNQKSSTAEQLATLNQVSSLLTGTLMPAEVLDTIITSSSMISDPSAVAVYLPANGSSSGGLQLARSAGLSDEFVQSAPTPVLMEKIVQGLPHTPVIAPNVETLEATALRHILLREGKRAFLELPLHIDGQASGIIVMYYNSPKPHMAETLDLMQAYANQAAQALRNSRTYARADQEREQRIQQLWMLAALGRVLSAAMDAQYIYDAVLGYAMDAAHGTLGAIALLEANRLVLVAHKGADETLVQGALQTHTLLYNMTLAGESARYEDIRQQSAYIPLSPNSRAALISPIMRGREILGVMVLESSQVGRFTQSDSDFVQQLCYQVVTVVENTRLFQSVRETRDNLQVILNAIEEGLILVNAQGQVAMANPRVTLLGMKPEDIADRPVSDLIENADLNFAVRMGFTGEETLRQMVEALRQPSRWNAYPSWLYEVPDVHGINHYVQRQIIPLRHNDGTLVGALLVFYDRTDEQELERARDSFTQMVVHDLRSPLTAVTTSLRLLQELVPPDSDFRPLVQKTTDASRRALRKVLSRVDSLLDIAKIESGTLYLAREPVDLSNLIDNVMTELQPLADELEVKIETDLPPDLPLLNADGDKVERMLLNLLDNALKYSPYETSIYVRARPDPGNPDLLRIAVSDEGPGIPNEYKMKLFDRFVQVEGRQAVRRGVGLGLAFCKLVAEAHGGSIWIEDNAPRGTRFVFTLPIWQSQPLPE